jgi:trigger factor
MAGDYIVTDLDCFVDDKPIHKKRENLWLAIEKGSYISDLTEKTVGMNKLEERDIEVTLPENYPDKAVAGKRARYHVLVKDIKERKLPALDDEFARDIGKASLEELRKEIAKELAGRAAANAETEAENALLNKLIDEHTFKVPSGFVARQLQMMVADSKRRLEEKGFKKEDLDKRDKELAEKFKADAERQVRLLFILDSIASTQHIEADDNDLGDAYRAMAAQSGKEESFVRDYYEKEGLVDNLREKLREGKTIKFLMDNAVVTEKE